MEEYDSSCKLVKPRNKTASSNLGPTPATVAKIDINFVPPPISIHISLCHVSLFIKGNIHHRSLGLRDSGSARFTTPTIRQGATRTEPFLPPPQRLGRSSHPDFKPDARPGITDCPIQVFKCRCWPKGVHQSHSCIMCEVLIDPTLWIYYTRSST